MHTAHLILVKAEDHEDAIATVRIALTPDDGSHFASHWSDWALVGDEGFGESRYSFRHEYEDWDGASSYAISLDDEGDLFHRELAKFYAFREKAFDRLRSEVSDEGFAFSLDQDDRASYALRKFAELADGVYTYESAIYDLEHYSTNLKHFRDKEAENGWYAVLVDFHF